MRWAGDTEGADVHGMAGGRGRVVMVDLHISAFWGEMVPGIYPAT